jgi:histidine triad (HIT) family protein
MYMDPSCLFCRVAAGEIPAEIVLETEHLIAFRDIQPKAPTHILLIPREHVASLDELEPRHGEMLGRLFLAARRVAHAEGLEGGWRTVVNVGADGGQSVYHLHVHLLGGRALSWPPG